MDFAHNPKNPVFSDNETYETVPKNSTYGTKWRTDVLSADDWLGHMFMVGDTVMYCIGAGHGQMMAIGKILKIRARTYDRGYWTGVWTPETPRVYVKTGEQTDVEVQVLTEKTSGSWDNTKRSKPAWVNPMNITAIPEGFTNE